MAKKKEASKQGKSSPKHTPANKKVKKESGPRKKESAPRKKAAAAAPSAPAEAAAAEAEGELFAWLLDQILLKWQGKLSPAHEAKLDSLPPPGDQWCSLKNQFRLACNVLGGSIEGEPADDVMKQVVDIAKEHVREGSPPTRPGRHPSDAWGDARAEEAAQLAKLDEFRATGKHDEGDGFPSLLASQFPLFEGKPPAGHPYPAAWTGKPPRPGAKYVPIHPSNGEASKRSFLKH